MQNKWIVVLGLFLIGCKSLPTGTPTLFQPTPSASIANSITAQVPEPTIFAATPLPALTSGEAHSLALELLATNSECRAPCFWGISPGETNVHDVQNLLRSFSEVTTRYYDFSETGGYIEMFLDEIGLFIGLDYRVENDVIYKLFVNTERLDFGQNGYHQVTDPKYYEWMQNYVLENVLAEFGRPSDIYFKSYNFNPGGFRTHTLLYYPDDGALFEYVSETTYYTNIQDQLIATTCPTEGSIELHFFAPGTLDLYELLAPHDNFGQYQPIASVTNMSVEGFLQTYIDGECGKRVETLADLWPEDFDANEP